MDTSEIISWLLEGDVAIQYQVHRDLLSTERKDLQDSIAQKGWGAKFLSKRHADGHWGREFYYPKWTSSHYTLLELRILNISPDNVKLKESVDLVLNTCKASDGGIRILKAKKSDVCVNGMFLNYASYFKAEENKLRSVIDCLLEELMSDGGFNCRSTRSGAIHSSLHTTLSVLEGFSEYERTGYSYRITEVKKAIETSVEFILLHQLFISDRTGEIINKDFLRFAYPRRWRYDILSALDYFQYSNTKWDDRMQPAIDHLLKKRNKDGTWNVNAKHPGQTYFDMEKAGSPSRWNTLRALRVLKHFGLNKQPILVIVLGLPGSGKSYFAERLAKIFDATYINSDRLRKELFSKRTYSDKEKTLIYDTMLKEMKAAISKEKSVVLDATFYSKEIRERFNGNANEKIHFIEVWAEDEIIKERLKRSRPYSEANYKVYQLIQKLWEPITETHLLLESTNGNIDNMLQKAIEYLGYEK